MDFKKRKTKDMGIEAIFYVLVLVLVLKYLADLSEEKDNDTQPKRSEKGMAYNLKDNRGMITEPISFRDASGVNADNIADLMAQEAARNGIPANIRTDYVKEGGLFGSSYPCVVITHPNPPQRYFTDVYIVNGNTVNFYFFGESKANTSTNIAKARQNSLSGKLLNAISGSNEMAYQQEMLWHRQIYELFEGFID